jgi:5-methylcytosine-specific restriction protein A
MATAPLRYCTSPGCSEKVSSGRCTLHQQHHRRAQRTTALHNLYDSVRWKRLRREHQRDYPWCVTCLAQGVKRPWQQLDHVVPHRGDLDSFWNGQLQGLCREHHQAKTRAGM